MNSTSNAQEALIKLLPGNTHRAAAATAAADLGSLNGVSVVEGCRQLDVHYDKKTTMKTRSSRLPLVCSFFSAHPAHYDFQNEHASVEAGVKRAQGVQNSKDKNCVGKK